MKFSEITRGRVIELGPRRVSEAEIIAFARQYDPQPFHVDPAKAAATRWRGLIASGWMTASMAMELVVPGILQGSGSIGSPGIDKLEWLHPVRPGDELRLRVTVLDSQLSKSGSTGVVRWEWQFDNQEGIAVMRLVATSLFDVTGKTAG